LLEGPLKGGPSAFGVKSVAQVALLLAVLKNSRQTAHITIKELKMEPNNPIGESKPESPNSEATTVSANLQDPSFVEAVPVTTPDSNQTFGYSPLPPAPEKIRRTKLVPIVVVTALISGLLGGLSARYLPLPEAGDQYRVELQQTSNSSNAIEEGSVADIAAKVTPSVVSISVVSGISSGTGSGFIIDSNGYILTNNHVVVDAAERGSITVDLSNGDSYKAEIVGRNAAFDLAVIKINATGLPVLPLGNSDELVVGDSVIAIGSPLGLSGTVTTGIISSLNRPVTTGQDGDASYINAIQTDAAINPGNSGGPLVNANGFVIGINSAIATTGASSQVGSIGLGFAIPINVGKRIAEEMIATGGSTIPIIGVKVNMDSSLRGGLIVEVEANGPADLAGVEVDDLVIRVNDRIVRSAVEFIVSLREYAPGEMVELEMKSGKIVSLALGSLQTFV
jgi:putative serine protease PepD